MLEKPSDGAIAWEEMWESDNRLGFKSKKIKALNLSVIRTPAPPPTPSTILLFGDPLRKRRSCAVFAPPIRNRRGAKGFIARPLSALWSAGLRPDSHRSGLPVSSRNREKPANRRLKQAVGRAGDSGAVAEYAYLRHFPRVNCPCLLFDVTGHLIDRIRVFNRPEQARVSQKQVCGENHKLASSVPA